MRVLLDEDIPRAFASVFTQMGWEVLDVHGLGIRGAIDADVFRAAQQHQAMLVTADLGFADIHRFPPSQHRGIIVLRLPDTLTVSARCRELRRLLRDIPSSELQRHLTIVAPNLLRFRS